MPSPPYKIPTRTPNPHKLQNHCSPSCYHPRAHSSAQRSVVARLDTTRRQGKAKQRPIEAVGMAGSARSAAAKHAYRMFAPSRGAAARSPGGAADEFDESEVWGSFGAANGVDAGSPAELASGRARPITASRAGGRKKTLVEGRGAAAAPGSLPMNIPDWQKILGVEYKDHHAAEWDLDGDDGDDYGRAGSAGGGSGVMIPPHELAWRSRAASLSVHEGIGRTLKGRDLSRVRDAVWKQTGFED